MLNITDITMTETKKSNEPGKYSLKLQSKAPGSEFIVSTSRFIQKTGSKGWGVFLKVDQEGVIKTPMPSLKAAVDFVKSLHDERVIKKLKKHNQTIESFKGDTHSNCVPGEKCKAPNKQLGTYVAGVAGSKAATAETAVHKAALQNIERKIGMSPALAAPYAIDKGMGNVIKAPKALVLDAISMVKEIVTPGTEVVAVIDKEMTAHLKQVTSADLNMLENFQPTMKKRVAYFLANKNRKQNFEMGVLYAMAGVVYGMQAHIKWRHDAQLVTFEEYDNQFKSMCVTLQECIDTIPNKQNNLYFLNFFLEGVNDTYGPMESRREVDRMIEALHGLSVKRACNNQPYASITILIKQCNYVRNRINTAQRARRQG